MRILLLAALLVPGARAAAPADIVVVLPGSPMAPYREALQGICDGLGACPPTLSAEDAGSPPTDARVVIALGGRAARRRYPAATVLVTALTPGYEARARRDSGAVTRVRLTLSPEDFARRLLSLKPDARRVALLWSEQSSGRFAAAVRAAGLPLGLDASPVEVAEPKELPALLRALPPADALWLAPDPALVTPTTFAAAAEYARSRGVPFFAPAPGLAERGAIAGLAPDFRASGLSAAAAARAALAGQASPEEAFPAAGPAPPPGPLTVSTKTQSGSPR